jgi:ribosomal protein S18 acetylase RimI-like enzyme
VDYIYPFWNAEFVNRATPGTIQTACSSWSREDIVVQSMGLKSNSLCIHLVMSDIPIGFCNVLILDEFDRYSDEHRRSMFSADVYSGALFLYNVVLVRGFRGQGYGSAFVQDVLETMKQQYGHSYSKVVFMVDRTNTGAQRMYERLGCVKVDAGNSETEWMYEWLF